MNQKNIFVSKEGNAWFNRNSPLITKGQESGPPEDIRYICETLKPFQGKIGKVLEIGCSNGMKLEAMCSAFNSKGIGIDPSTAAVENGNARNKEVDISLLVGTGDKLPVATAEFDLVYFAFCLYLFDRDFLFQSLAEADRALKPGGFLAITDFDPGLQHKRIYSHCDGVYSYKQDYSSFYSQSGLYYLAGKHCHSHQSGHFDESPHERVSTSILYKEIDSYPILG